MAVLASRLRTPTDSRELRSALGAFPTGVTVVTCVRSDGTPVGITANSFVSLSLSPPLVSVALHTRARHLIALLESGAFAVNVLCADQHALLALFTRPSECSWADVRFRSAPSGHLVLDGAAACFLCRLCAQHPVGDHTLLVGEVEQFAHDTRIEPLAFLRGRYGSFRIAGHTAGLEPIDLWSAPTTGWS